MTIWKNKLWKKFGDASECRRFEKFIEDEILYHVINDAWAYYHEDGINALEADDKLRMKWLEKKRSQMN